MEVHVHDRAHRFLRSLPPTYRGRIENAMRRLGRDPFPREAVKVKGYDKPVFRVRVGSYRILYYVRREDDAVYVIVVDKRARVYDRH